MTRPCIALLGGSFDPVHNGHVALGEFFVRLLNADGLRIIPAGNPWQKHGLQAPAADRVEMVRCAFDNMPLSVVIDLQEIDRRTATYTIDTLKVIRSELGEAASLVFLIGADHLQQLDTWHEWQRLFDYAHVCAAARPGFALDAAHVPAVVRAEFARRAGTPQQIRNTAYGMTYLAENFAADISATEIRAALQHGQRPEALVPSGVLDYIEQHHLYKN